MNKNTDQKREERKQSTLIKLPVDSRCFLFRFETQLQDIRWIKIGQHIKNHNSVNLHTEIHKTSDLPLEILIEVQFYENSNNPDKLLWRENTVEDGYFDAFIFL